MIFVTVGTGEQQFDRLVKEVDRLKLEAIIEDDIFIQTGYCSYVPKACEHAKLISYDEMVKKTKDATIIITHGGPGSIMLALSLWKVPIVVPREKIYDEVVDNHQVYFTKKLRQENKVLAVYNINDLKEYILNYSSYTKDITYDDNDSNRDEVIRRLYEITNQIKL